MKYESLSNVLGFCVRSNLYILCSIYSYRVFKFTFCLVEAYIVLAPSNNYIYIIQDKAKFLTCFIINSESSSNLFLSPDCSTISDLFTTNTIGIPMLVFNSPSFSCNCSFRLTFSSEGFSFLKFPSSSNCGSSYSLRYSTTGYY